MDKFAPLSKFARVQINLHMCKSDHENGALIDFIPIYFIKLNLKIIQNQMTSLIDSNHRNDGTI